MKVRYFSPGLALVALIAAANAGCGDDDSSPRPAGETQEATSTAGAGHTPLVTSTLPPPLASPTGQPRRHTVALPELGTLPTEVVRSSSALPSLQGWASDDEIGASPVAAFGDRFVIQRMYLKRPAEHPVSYELWDPTSKQTQPLWTVPAGKLNEFSAADGAWLITVETGYSLPLPKWSLVLHNLDSGEVRTVATSDDRIPSLAQNVQLGPAGFAPLPAIGGGRTAWVEFYVTTSGHLGKRLQIYDIGRNQIETIDSVEDASQGDLESPSMGGQDLAWLRRERAEPALIQVRGLSTGLIDSYEIGGDPYSASLSEDGSFLVWDDTQYAQRGTRAKYALLRASGAVTRYSESKGWGTYVGGKRVSWTPWENDAGFYDMVEGVLYRLDLQGAKTVYATVMGSWYVWQETRDTGEGREQSEATYYFLKLQ